MKLLKSQEFFASRKKIKIIWASAILFLLIGFLALRVDFGQAAPGGNLVFDNLNITGDINQPLNAQISVQNPDNEFIKWEFDMAPDVADFFDNLKFENNSNSDHNVLVADNISASGQFPITIKLVDNHGDTLLEQNAFINVAGNSNNFVVNPVLNSLVLNGFRNQVFNGFVSVNNPGGYSLTWNLNVPPSTASKFNQLYLLDSGDNNSRAIISNKALFSGSFPITITADDQNGSGAHFEVNSNIVITNPVPTTPFPITFNYAELTGDVGYSFDGVISVSNPDNRHLTWSLDTSSIQAGSFNGLTLSQTNDYMTSVTASKANIAGSFPVTIKVEDDNGQSLSTTTNITIKAPASVGNFSLLGGVDDEFEGTVEINNPSNQNLHLALSTSSIPAGSFEGGPVLLSSINTSGLITGKIYAGKALKPGNFPITVLVVDSTDSIKYSFTTNIVIGVKEETSLDAIAIRILPNPEHYGIERWYKERGFTGSPQFLMVDGYEAVRDGRTVYVNATNVSGSTIYTNVYLISYNQESKTGTTDALGQIISNWKFNNNFSAPGTCSLNSSSTASCMLDSDCHGDGFCNNPKAKIIRDVKRLSILAQIKDALNVYKQKNGRYPDLPSGTYVPHLSISTWPSWQSTFTAQLGISGSLVDPVNKFGACPGPYDPKTCWDKDHSKFAVSLNDLKFPTSSLVMAYQSKNNGGQYYLCASMETDVQYNTTDGLLQGQDCNVVTATSTNIGPSLEAINLQGEVGKEFAGFIKVANPNGNPLTWNISVPQTTAVNFVGGPVLVNTNNDNQKKIYATKASAVGNFPLTVTVSDNRGGNLVITRSAIITKTKPKIEAENSEYILANNPKLSYSFYLNDDSIASGTLPVYTLKVAAGGNTYNTVAKPSTLGSAVLMPNNNNLKHKIEQIARGRYKVTIFQDSPSIPSMNDGLDHQLKYQVAFANSISTSTKDFVITLKQEKPIFDYKCEENVRQYGLYNCIVKILNTNNHSITYTTTGVPSGITAITASDGSLKISGNSPSATAPSATASSSINTIWQDQSSWLTNHLNASEVLSFQSNAVLVNDLSSIEDVANDLQTGYTTFLNVLESKLDSAGSLLFDFSTKYNSGSGALYREGFLTPKVLKMAIFIKDIVINWQNNFVLSARAATNPTNSYTISIIAKNEYGATNTTSFNLKVNNYCGDGIKQDINQEGRGGAYNDGSEECDGVDGVATSTQTSSVSKQYSCSTIGNTINPITSNNFCRATGGYCGDGLCGSVDNTYQTDNFEIYDPLFNNSDRDQYCHADCPYCGDGLVQKKNGEQCDPGDPYSFDSTLSETCNVSCKLVRELRILQVYPNATSSHTVLVGPLLSSLGNQYPSFVNFMPVPWSKQGTSTINYQVNLISMAEFNNNTSSYLPSPGNILSKYNLIVFGMGDHNGADLNTTSALLVKKFIQSGGMSVFGRGTFYNVSPYNSNNIRKFNDLINLGGVTGNGVSAATSSSITMYINPLPSSTPASVYQIPFTLPSSTPIDVNNFPKSYTTSEDGTSCGKQCGPNDCVASSSLSTRWFGSWDDQASSWANTCNRVAVTQLGYAPGMLPSEAKIFANLLYHLSTIISPDNF